MNLIERVALKNRLISESGLTQSEWQAAAIMEANAAGIELNAWIELGQNVSDKLITTTAIFTEAEPTSSEEDSAESTKEEPTLVEQVLKVFDLAEETDLAAKTEETILDEEKELPVTESVTEPDQAESLRKVAAQTTAASDTEVSDTESAKDIKTEVLEESTVVKKNSEIEVVTVLTKEPNLSPKPVPANVDKALPVEKVAITADNTKAVLGKEDGPAITESSEFASSYSDLAVEKLFKKVDADVKATDASPNSSGDAYAEFIENHVSKLCQTHRVSNLDITSFGIRAQSINFKQLKLLAYGKHKFLGAELTPKEEEAIVFRLGLYCQQNDKEKIAIKAVSEVKDSTGFVFYTLLFTESVIQKLANATDFTIYINGNESDVSKLMVVVEKCSNKNSILG